MKRLCQVLSITIVLMLTVLGCSRSPEARKARHLERGDTYFGRQQYREAVLEYRHVLRAEPTNAHAIKRLGVAHYTLGELVPAYPFLLKTKELDPNNLDARVKLGAILLIGRKPKEAREEAEAVLSRDAKNLEALILVASTANTEKEVDSAIRRLEDMRADFNDRARYHITLGTLYAAKRDAAGAERSFRDAVAREPRSVEAHTALGNFHMSRRDAAQAEQEFKAAADLAPIGSAARINLADFYLVVGKPEAARQILGEMTEKAPEFLPAWRRLAEIAFAEQKYDESIKAVEMIFKRNPSDLEGHHLLGRVHLARRETAQAIQEFQKVLKREPRFAPARYQLALAYLQAGNLQQAKAELMEAATINPDSTEATLRLAELNIQTGALQPAIEELERLIARQPNENRAHVLLGSAYLAKREPVKATDAYRKLLDLAPRNPLGPHLVGVGLRAQGKTAEARKQFEAALSLAPGYVEPLAHLVDMSLAEKQPAAALERVKLQAALVPKSPGVHFLQGEAHRARGDTALAEAAYLKALDLEPSLIDAYLRLGDLYATSGKYDQALLKLNDALKIHPNSLKILMLSGMIYERKRDFLKAQEMYEKVLALNPRFALAANNLAYLYSEHGGDREKALELAQRAKEVSPDHPYISDTLGWILYKRGIYQRSLALFQESAIKLADHPEFQYHLGMAHYKVGNSEAAKQALARALKSKSEFAGSEEARRTLAELN